MLCSPLVYTIKVHVVCVRSKLFQMEENACSIGLPSEKLGLVSDAGDGLMSCRGSGLIARISCCKPSQGFGRMQLQGRVLEGQVTRTPWPDSNEYLFAVVLRDAIAVRRVAA
jgi:hypothetical protein